MALFIACPFDTKEKRSLPPLKIQAIVELSKCYLLAHMSMFLESQMSCHRNFCNEDLRFHNST